MSTLADMELVIGMARSAGLTPQAFITTLQQTIFAALTPTPAQLVSYLMECQRYDLDPLNKRLVFPVKDRNGGIVPVLSIDGWLAMILRHEQYNGMDTVEMFTDEKGGNPREFIAVRCTIHRKDRGSTVVTEYLDECTRDSKQWKEKPKRMLRHKAVIQCARYAFGLSIYDPDEAAQIVDQEPKGFQGANDDALAQLRERIANTKSTITQSYNDSNAQAGGETLEP